MNKRDDIKILIIILIILCFGYFSFNKNINKHFYIIRHKLNQFENILDNKNNTQKDNIEYENLNDYMKYMQKTLRQNWHPTSQKNSYRVVLLFKLDKKGNLISCKIQKTSGSKKADREALDSVKRAAPFKPLPKNYLENDVDILYTFEYNVHFNKNKK